VAHLHFRIVQEESSLASTCLITALFLPLLLRMLTQDEQVLTCTALSSKSGHDSAACVLFAGGMALHGPIWVHDLVVDCPAECPEDTQANKHTQRPSL
jgi:hypothetical protein